LTRRRLINFKGVKIPRRLKIGGHDIQVRVEKKWIIGEHNSEEDDGLYDSATNTIYLSAQLAPSKMESTLIHEILHVLNLELDHDLLSSLAEQLYQVLKDNNLLK
jgi:hypothetical protein